MKMRKKTLRIETSLFGISLAIIATFITRGLGFIRELLTATIFGTSSLGDAFIIAVSIPDILVSGFSFTIVTLYVPLFFKVKKENKENEYISRFNASVFSLMLITGIIIFLVIEFFPKQVLSVFASGFDKQTKELTESLLRIVAFSVVPIFLSSLFKAYGQVVNKFSIMTLYGGIINLSIIFALLIFRGTNLFILAWSVTVGNILYMVISYVFARSSGYNLFRTPCLNNKYLKEMLLNIFPVFAANIISEINQMIDKNFASLLGGGTISALNYSSKIINLITAILGTTIASVLFSKLSEIYMNGNKKQFVEEVKSFNCLLLLILLPIFYTILFFGDSIISLLFGHGAFDLSSIKITTECLSFYSLGIIGFNIKAIWVRIYNVSLDTKTIAINTACTIFINIVLNTILVVPLGHKGLAFATVVSILISDYMLIIKYQEKNEFFQAKQLTRRGIKIVIISSIYIPLFATAKILKVDNVLINVLIILLFFLISTFLYIVLLVKMDQNIASKIKFLQIKKIIRGLIRN